MTMFRKCLVASGVAVLSLFSAMPAALAGGVCPGLTLSCENGRSYPLCPIAVSVEGEIVTGRLGLAPGRGVHVRTRSCIWASVTPLPAQCSAIDRYC
jgi:hypothetical protein